MNDAFWRRFLVPGALWLAFFFAVPFGIAIAISFGQASEFGGVSYGWHPENYGDALDPLFAPILLRSVGYAAATALLCLAIGYPVAYTIARFGGRWKNALIAFVLLPFLINYLVRTYAWVALLSDEGLLANLVGQPLGVLNTPVAVIGGLVYGYLGFMILPVYASLERMDWKLVEAATDLGASPFKAFRQITLPLTLPGLITGALLVFIPMCGEYVIPQLLGGGQFAFVGTVIGSNFLGAQNWPFGSAMAIAFMVLLSIFVVIYIAFATREEQFGA